MGDDLPASSDDLRSAEASAHRSIWRSAEPLTLVLGGELPGLEVAYETWGVLAPGRLQRGADLPCDFR